MNEKSQTGDVAHLEYEWRNHGHKKGADIPYING